MARNKFVLLTEERCGYQHLAELLNSHPDIVFLGEIFAPLREIREGSMFLTGHRIIEDESGEKFLMNVMNALASDKFFGFKLQYSHAWSNPLWCGVWDKIVEEQWSVVHLIRDNLLDRYISHQLAMLENNWQNRPYQSQIVIDPKDFDECTKRSLWFRKEAYKKFSNNPMFEISYEEYISDPQKLINLQQFIGVPPILLTSTKKKQRMGSQKDCVLNFVELYKLYKGSEYANWFESTVLMN